MTNISYKPPDTLTVREAVTRFGIKEPTLRNALRLGKIPSVLTDECAANKPRRTMLADDVVVYFAHTQGRPGRPRTATPKAPPTRGRGRPPKVAQETPNVPKRPVGRPRKLHPPLGAGED